jgi:16S rRNA pseudouridine516 synthase
MKLAKYLANLGYGTRKDADRLVALRRVTQADGRVLVEGDRFAHDDVRVDGVPLDPPPGALIILNKPVGYVCSTSDVPPLVYELLPPRFLHRSPVMATVGRLDRETSGLLLLTDDGKLNHRLTSPRSHIPKTYEARLANPLNVDDVERFASGTLLLESDPEPLAPATLQPIDERHVRITLQEGRYHQVRRMFAAVGNHVEQLERIAIGGLSLGNLAEGSWRVVTDEERALLAPVSSLPQQADATPGEA